MYHHASEWERHRVCFGISSGGLGVTYTNGLTISTDNCPVFAGRGFPGSYDVWPATRGRYGHGVRLPGRGRPAAKQSRGSSG